MQENLSNEESALIMQSIQHFLLKLRGELEDPSDKEFLHHQIKVAQSVFEKVLDLRLSDDGTTVSSAAIKIPEQEV